MAIIIRITGSDGSVREIESNPGDQIAIEPGDKVKVLGVDPDLVKIVFLEGDLGIVVGGAEPILLKQFNFHMQGEDGSVSLTIGDGDGSTVVASLDDLEAFALTEFETAAGGPPPAPSSPDGDNGASGTGGTGELENNGLNLGPRVGVNGDNGPGAGDDDDDDDDATFVVNAHANNPPVAGDNFFEVDEDGAVTDQLAGSDPDGDPITFTLTTGPVYGAVTVNGDGSFTYTPDADWSGGDTFSYLVTDSHGATAAGATAVTINPTGDVVVSKAPATQDGGTDGGAFNEIIATAQYIPRSDFGVQANPDVGDDSLPWVSIQGTNDGKTDVDFYAIELKAGEKITLDIDYGQGSGGNVDSMLWLYDASGSRVAMNDDAMVFPFPGGDGSTSDFDSYVTFTAPADGVYYAAFTASYHDPRNSGGRSSDATGDYVLNVSIDPNDPGEFGTNPQTIIDNDNVTPIIEDGGQIWLNFTADITDVNGQFPELYDAVTVTFNGLPAGSTVDGVTPGADPYVWTAPAGTNVEIEDALADLSVTTPEDWNGSFDATLLATSNEGGYETVTQTVDVAAVNDAPVLTIPETPGGGSSVDVTVFSQDFESGHGSNERTGGEFTFNDTGINNGTMGVGHAAGEYTDYEHSWYKVTVDLDGIDDSTLSFDFQSDIEGYADGFYVTAKANGVETRIDPSSGMVYDVAGSYVPGGWAYGGYTRNGNAQFDLSAYDGQETTLGFHFYSDDVYGFFFKGMNIDNVVVSGVSYEGWVTDEDTALIISGISVSDVDVAETPGGELLMALNVGNGALALSGVVGLSGDTDGSDGILSFTGTVGDINTALAGLTYTPDLNYYGSDILTVNVNDQGNTGLGGPLDDTETLNITVNDVTDQMFTAGDDIVDLRGSAFANDPSIDNPWFEDGNFLNALGGNDWVYLPNVLDALYTDEYAGKLFHGGDGADTIWGGTGADLIEGDSGGDELYGWVGNDFLYGDADADSSNGGNDTLWGDSGDDFLYGDAGYESYDGGNDTLEGGNGADTLYGDAGNTSLFGGDDTLYGGDGDDTLYGDAGNKSWYGGADKLYGGDGADTLYGDAGGNSRDGGADTFVFKSGDTGVDTIKDFSTAEGDVLDISDLLTGYVSGTSYIDDFVTLTEGGGNTTVEVDGDGLGSGSSYSDVVVLEGVTGLDLDTLLADGNIDPVV